MFTLFNLVKKLESWKFKSKELNNHRLVLQLIFGLTTTYQGVTTMIFQSNPIPSFHHAHFMFTLDKADLANTTSVESPAAYLTIQQRASNDLSQSTNCRSGNCSCSCNVYNRGGNHRNYCNPRGGTI